MLRIHARAMGPIDYEVDVNAHRIAIVVDDESHEERTLVITFGADDVQRWLQQMDRARQFVQSIAVVTNPDGTQGLDLMADVPDVPPSPDPLDYLDLAPPT